MVTLRATWCETITWVLLLTTLVSSVRGQACPWSRELVDLHADCICAYNSVQRLSIQCSPVNFTRLMEAIRTSVRNIPIDLLYVNNSTVDTLADGVFADLDVQGLHLSRCRVRSVSGKAFQGLESSLTSLNLQENLLKEVPVEALERLTLLKQLDLSHNQISLIPDRAFQHLPLSTLKLADNQLNVSDEAFAGLEGTLKNLNLKGAGLTTLPTAIHSLTALAFLDLAQNKIEKIETGSLAKLHTLTALNLERNRIINIDSRSFLGVNDTLSSLSLLNNLLVEFPTDAMSLLTEIRVLDLGFNGIRSIPDEAFQHNPFLTLLALDGNPLETLPLAAFKHLNTTIRGLSIGGSYLVCDCHIRWVAQWVRDYDLQVTSRERNPQFCGKPDHLKRRPFFQLTPGELTCEGETPPTVSITTTTTTPKPSTTSTTTTSTANATTAKSTPVTSETLVATGLPVSGTTKGPKRLPDLPEDQKMTTTKWAQASLEDGTMPSGSFGGSVAYTPSPSPVSSTQVPVKRYDDGEPATRVSGHGTEEEIQNVEVSRKDSTLLVEWEAVNANVLGFQVVYRFFGEKEFRLSQPLPQSQRRFILPNLPPNECVVICVVAVEEAAAGITPENVPQAQCREVKSGGPELDKIVIGASAAVCGVVVLAVVVFVCCYRRSRRKDKPPSHHHHHHSSGSATLPAALKSDHEWETVSMYSGRSIPRARMYHLDPSTAPNGSVNHSFIMDDTRSHLSHYSQVPNGYPKSRPTADGQSHRSFSQLSHRFSNGVGAATATTTTSLGHPDLRKSQQSLSQLSGHHSYLGSHSQLSASPKKKSKSRTSNGRLTSASSLHSLTEYDSDWNARSENWRDNEVDIYVGQNHVVPTHTGKYRKDYPR